MINGYVFFLSENGFSLEPPVKEQPGVSDFYNKITVTGGMHLRKNFMGSLGGLWFRCPKDRFFLKPTENPPGVGFCIELYLLGNLLLLGNNKFRSHFGVRQNCV